MMPLHPCQLIERGGTFWIKHDHVLTAKQAKLVNKELNTGNNAISIKKIMTPSIPEETELDNAYQKTLTTGYETDIRHNDKKKSPAQMKEWSILSDHVKYITSDRSKTFNNLSIDQLNYRQDISLYRELQEKESLSTNVNFGSSSAKLRSEYLDMYEGIYAEIVSSDRFDEDTDLSTMYLGQMDMTRDMEVKAKENFPITVHGYTKGKLLDGTECGILVDTGMSKSYMSKSYFLRYKSLHSLPKFTSATTRIQVGNEQYVGVLFIIPVILTIQSHRFEIFMLVSEIHENIDLTIGIKNLFELEGVIDSWDSCVKFLNRSIPFFPKEKVTVKPKEQKMLTLEAPFMEEISGMAITKMLDAKEQKTLTMKLKFIRNRAIFKVMNSTHEAVTFDPKEILGIIDLRSLGYYKIKQGVLQQNLSCMYHFESVNEVCNQFNRLINTLKREEKETCDTDRYPWLDDSDERKHMTDKEILDKYIDLKDSCLTKQEKQKLRDIIYDYKDAFSLRDEIGTCPNIKVEIDVTDNSPFFIRPFHAKEEDKAILDKEMKQLCYLGILKEGFLAYSSLVMLISQKVTQDKRVVMDFRHLNMRIAKNNLAYPLLKDTFTLLGGSKCEVLSVLDLKDAFHSLRLTESSKKYCGILPYFGSASCLYQRMPMGLNISPMVWQSYINAILSCLSSRKYCEAIMDDLLLFMPNKQMHFEKLVDLLRALCKNGLKISPKKCQLFKTELQYMGNTIFIKDKRVCVKPVAE